MIMIQSLRDMLSYRGRVYYISSFDQARRRLFFSRNLDCAPQRELYRTYCGMSHLIRFKSHFLGGRNRKVSTV